MGDGERNRPDREADVNDQFRRAVEAKARRKLKARSAANRGVWFWLGMFGLVGWSVMLPTVGGIALGVWLERRWPSTLPWMLIGVLAGVSGGCLTAWYWVRRESRAKDKRD